MTARITHLLMACLVCGMVMAVPARRQKRTLTLHDGSRIEAEWRGDEHVHFYATADGRTFLTDSAGMACEVEPDSLKARWEARLEARNSLRKARAARRRAAWGAESNPISGRKKGLVILVNYADRDMVYTRADFDDFFNKEGYTGHGFNGSVHDYFKDMSYGAFDLTFDVVGPVTVSRELGYYGQNNRAGTDMYAALMVSEAVRLADPYVDFSDYDWDNDGEVDQVFVIYAGYGEAQWGPEDTIWPHEFELSSAKVYGDGPGALSLDGVRIDTYACSCELHGNSGSDIDGIGTACHEFSHCMCIPDMYDASGYSFGMDRWDLMDYGAYNGFADDGGTPASYTAYERMYCGWLTPVELTDPAVVSGMAPITSSPEAYMIRNNGNANEYYILENRQNESWDRYQRGHGMLVVHVDFDRHAWANNTVNNTASHQRMTIIPADNSLGHNDEDLVGDPWPGFTGNTELTDNSVPAATLYNDNAYGHKYMSHPITDIAESSDGRIGFVFDGGVFVSVPDGLLAENVTETGFTARWQAVKGADYYNVELTETVAASGSDSRILSTVTTYETPDTHICLPIRGSCDYDYSFRVRAVVGDIFGEWSRPLAVSRGNAIAGVMADKEQSDIYYDLQGRRLSSPKSGVFIHGGRKRMFCE